MVNVIARTGASRRASGQQLPAHSVQLMTWPQRKLRRKVLSVEGALIAPPSTCSILPARSTSAMQSPLTSADATKVSVSSLAFARPGIPQVNVMIHQLAQAQMMGQRDWKLQSGIGHQAVVVEGNSDAIRGVAW